MESAANTRRAKYNVKKGYLYAVQQFGVTHMLPYEHITTHRFVVLTPCRDPPPDFRADADNYPTFA